MSSNILPRSATRSVAAILLALFTSVLLVACGGDSVIQATRYTIGGAVSGLVGTGLVLQDNNGDNLTVSATGSFTFATPLTNGSSYSVGVATQPTSPSQNCVVTSGVGTVNGANVRSVEVACSTEGFTVGGTVNGLSGSGLVLQDNGGNDLPITAAAAFTFSTTVGSGVAYAVTVKTQPTYPTQTCSVSNPSGTIGNANVTNVVVNCTVISTYTVSGTITGLAGTGLELQTHGTNIPITGSTFSVSLASGTAYQVQVTTQPTNATQNCVVTNGGPGTVTNANISNVMVACTTTFTVTVNATFVSGANTGLTLFDNGADSLSVTGTGQFTFATPVASGTTYVVTVATQPTSTPAQYCIVTGGTGTVTTAAITNVNVSCRNVGQALFVANTYDGANGSVSGFMIDSTSGNLAGVGSPYAAHMNPSAIALDVSGQYAYVANLNSADVTTFSVSPTTGILSPIGNTLTSGVLTFSVAVDPMGGYVFAGSDSGGAEGLVDTFSIIAPTSPGLSLVPSPLTVGNDPLALAVDPTGSFVFAPERYDDTVWVLNIGTGGVLSNGNNSPFTNGTGSGPAGVAVYPTGGYIYVANAGNFRSVPSEPLTSYSGTVSAYAYDGTTGALTPLTSLGSPYAVGSGTGSGATGITIDPTGRFLYVTAFNDGTVSAFSIAPLTGALSAVGSPVVTGSQPTDVKVDPSGHFAYVANSGTGTVSEYTIDPTTGILTLVTNGGTVASGGGAAAIALE